MSSLRKIIIVLWVLTLFIFPTASAETPIGKDGSLIVFDSGIVLDSESNLMWSQSDNGKDISWLDAMLLAQSSSLASFNDWRLPTKKELAVLIKEKPNDTGLRISQLFHLESIFLYASKTKRCKAAYVDLSSGSFHWVVQSRPDFGRVLLVRNTQ